MLTKRDIRAKLEADELTRVVEYDSNGKELPREIVKASHFYPVWMSEARCDRKEYTGGPDFVAKEGEAVPEKGEDTHSEDSDEDFDNWYKRDIDNETYFVLVNNDRKPFKAGDQVYYCYGNRSNRYLLVNYGFCFKNNHYDSYPIFMNMNIDFSEPHV
jgi:hypothetical protein